MSQPELLKRTATLLNRLGVPFMLTGSLVSSLQGAPRATHDIDLVVDLSLEGIDDLVEAFPAPDYYLNRQGITEAVQNGRTFNLLDSREGDKVDFRLLTGDAFDQSRFARRQRIVFDRVPVDVSSPEDTILMKLRWAHASGGSEKHFRDALRVYEVQHGVLDDAYVARWVAALEVGELWRRLVCEAKPGG